MIDAVWAGLRFWHVTCFPKGQSPHDPEIFTMLALRPETSVPPAALLPPPERPPAAVIHSATKQSATASSSPAQPAGLRSDRFALMFWLACVGLMSILLLKDLVIALFSR
jgi:hypothetical protein